MGPTGEDIQAVPMFSLYTASQDWRPALEHSAQPALLARQCGKWGCRLGFPCGYDLAPPSLMSVRNDLRQCLMPLLLGRTFFKQRLFEPMEAVSMNKAKLSLGGLLATLAYAMLWIWPVVILPLEVGPRVDARCCSN